MQLVCQPKTEGKISEVVQFEVAKKSIPLQLNVKYECYKAKHTLELLPENPLTGLVQKIGQVHDVDFGNVFLADSKSRVFKLANIGQTDVVFSLELGLDRIISTARRDVMELRKCQRNVLISVENAQARDGVYTVQPHASALITVQFKPVDQLTLDKQFGLNLKIKAQNAGVQCINLLGKSTKPGLQASVQELEFGTVIADLKPERCQTRTVRLTNCDRQPLNIEYVSDCVDFNVVTEPLVDPLQPGQHVDVQVRFQPVFAQEFEARLNVTVNGLYKLTYPMRGTAVYSQFSIDQKTLQVGSILIKSKPGFKMAAIRNNSLANVSVRVELDN